MKQILHYTFFVCYVAFCAPDSYAQQSIEMKTDSLLLLKKYHKIPDKQFRYYSQVFYDSSVLYDMRDKELLHSWLALNQVAQLADWTLKDRMDVYEATKKANLHNVEIRHSIIENRLAHKKSTICQNPEKKSNTI